MTQEKNELRALAEAQKAFTDWRLSKKSQGEPTPDALWQIAFGLLKDFTVARVATALRLQTSILKKRAIEAGISMIPAQPVKKKSPKKTRKDNVFIEVGKMKMPDPNLVSGTAETRVTFTRPDGSRMELEGLKWNQECLDSLMKCFLGG